MDTDALRALAGRGPWDVIIAGGGNAALVAALTAREAGSRVLLIERGLPHMRGGNTRHTRNIRCAHDTGDEFTPGTYSTAELVADLGSVGRPIDPDLTRLAAAESLSMPAWMSAHGVRWQHPLRGTLSLSRTNRFFLGGGTALVNTYYRAAEQAGVDIVYETTVCDLEMGSGVEGVRAHAGDETVALRARAVVVACGGFEANVPWLKRYWGPAADNYVIRGTPNNDGLLFSRLIALGARTVGDPKGFHAIAVDARAPKFDGGIATRLDSVPFSIVVNKNAQRFADEGKDIWPKRYASWGRLIAEQPDQLAYSIYDSRTQSSFMPAMFPPISSPTLAGLACAVGLDPAALERTVREYNANVHSSAPFTPERKDGRSTNGLVPPKSNWALRIDRPPFFALPLRPGITFTYHGLAVNARAQVLDAHGSPFPNLFAAGEVMSGNILSDGYLAGFGVAIGHVFGRIAGREAAAAAH